MSHSAPRALKGNFSGVVWSLVLRKNKKKIFPGKAFSGSNSFSPAAVAPKRRSGFSTAVPMSLTTSFSPSCQPRVAKAGSGEHDLHDSVSECPVAAGGGQPRGLKVAATSTSGCWGLLEKSESDFSKNLAERSDVIGCLSQTDFPSLSASGCVASACALLPAAAPASSLVPASRVSSPAVFAVGSHARSTPMHDARNSCSNTAINSLRDQRCRKVRSSRTVGIRSVVQTVDMSPALVAGTYRRSADILHVQRQIPRKRRAESSGGGPGPGPGPGPGGRSGLVGRASGLAAAFRWIPCSLVMPPGRHQCAPQSHGWARVCGTEKSGVWVLKGDARTYNLPIGT